VAGGVNIGCEQGVQSDWLELSKHSIGVLCSLAGICHFLYCVIFSFEIQSCVPRAALSKGVFLVLYWACLLPV